MRDTVDAVDRRPLAAVIACASITYVLTAARTVLGGDNGELATLFVTGGAAHSPGYPLYVLYLRLFRALPASSPAHGAALATALLGAMSVAALSRACLAWGASVASSAIALAIYAFSSLAWILSTHAEVFAMNALFAALILWLASPSPPLRGGSQAIALAFVAGLALAHHHTIVTLAPVGLWGAIRGARDAHRRGLTGIASLAALALGLSPYAYVWSCAHHGADPATWTWGGVHDGASFWGFLRRSEYPDANISSHAHIIALAWRVTVELAGLPLFAVMAGALSVSRTKRVELSFALLIASLLLAGPVFALIFNLPLEGIGRAVTERFYLLPMLLLTVLGARSLDVLLAPFLVRREVSIATTALVMVGAGALAWPNVKAHHRPYVEQYVQNALKAAPPNAVILGSGDERFGAFLYARYALNARPDVTFVSPRLLLAPWYHARMEAALGVPLVQPEGRHLNMTAFVRDLLSRGKPVVLANSFLPQFIEARFPSYPLGTLIVIANAHHELPPPPVLEAENVALFDSFAREIDPPFWANAWIRDLSRDYQRPWLALAQAYAAAGPYHDEDGAQRNRARAAEYEAGPSWDEP